MPVKRVTSDSERRSRAEILDGLEDVRQWPTPNRELDVPSKHLTTFDRRATAVRWWVAGKSSTAIFNETELPHYDVHRLVLRCTQRTAGRLVGFWGCIPGRHVVKPKPYARTAEATAEQVETGCGLSGQLQRCFVKYPEIERGLKDHCNRRSDGAARVSLVTPATVTACFYALCKESGIAEDEWPFNAKRRGYDSVLRWFHAKRYENPVQTADNRFGEAAGQMARNDYSSTAAEDTYKRLLCYERVELDEHHFDQRWRIELPLGPTTQRVLTTSRIWVLTLIECRSGAILSNTLSYRKRYIKEDVNRLIVRALEPPPRRTLFLANQHFGYEADAAFPAELKGLERNTWSTLAFDGDRTHFSAQMLAAAEYIVGCALASEAIGNPTARPSIEGFFAKLTALARAMPAPTGNRTDSSVRRDPDKQALEYHVLAPLAEALFDVFCRNYNCMRSARCEGLTRLAFLQYSATKGQTFLSQLGELRESNLWMLLPMFSAEATRRRHTFGPLGIWKFGARYVGPALDADAEFARQEDRRVRLFVQEDARYAFAVPEALPDRCYPVKIAGELRGLPHTMEWRRHATNAWKTARSEDRADRKQQMFGFLRSLAEASATSDPAAALLAGTMAFLQQHSGDSVEFVSLSPQARDALDEYTDKIGDQDDGEMEDSEPAYESDAGRASAEPPPIIVPPPPRIWTPPTFDPFA